MKDKIIDTYKKRFGQCQIYVNAPGRANIIGEHTDYNHGLVLPFAIEQSIGMAIGQNSLKKLRLVALDVDEEFEMDLMNISFKTDGWSRYFINSLVALSHSITDGIDVVFGGNLPQGGGVSSSSALTCGFLSGINQLFEYKHDLASIIDLASQAENGIGLNGGVMDQTAILEGKKGKAMIIDFLNLTTTEINIPTNEFRFYIFNSGQKHNLVDTEYNKRRATCDAVVRQVSAIDPSVNTFRQVTLFHIENVVDGEVAKKRAIHVIEENERVRKAATALSQDKFELLGPLIDQSHESLSKNYEVSTPEIDYLVHCSRQISNLIGARIMGGGFGGCTINLVKGKLEKEDIIKLKSRYQSRTNFELSILEVNASDGVRVERV